MSNVTFQSGWMTDWIFGQMYFGPYRLADTQ